MKSLQFKMGSKCTNRAMNRSLHSSKSIRKSVKSSTSNPRIRSDLDLTIQFLVRLLEGKSLEKISLSSSFAHRTATQVYALQRSTPVYKIPQNLAKISSGS